MGGGGGGGGFRLGLIRVFISNQILPPVKAWIRLY